MHECFSTPALSTLAVLAVHSQASHKYLTSISQAACGSCCSFGKLAKGVGAIVEEIETRGTDTDKECLNYVLRQRAGSSPLLFSNSAFPRDTDANGLRGDRKSASGEGMNLDDFVAHRDAQKGGLAHAHVLALRLYSTAAFRSLNECAAPAFSCLLNAAPAFSCLLSAAPA